MFVDLNAAKMCPAQRRSKSSLDSANQAEIELDLALNGFSPDSVAVEPRQRRESGFDYASELVCRV